MLLMTGCDLLESGGKIDLTIIDNNVQSQVKVASGISVKQALEEAQISLNPLDKLDPPSTTVLTEDTTVTITRVTEEFESEQAIVPFEQQTVKNESLPEGQTVLIQSGANGIQQNTYRILYENGVETSRTFVSSEITLQSRPEIVMIGVQSPFTAQSITGMIAYITSSNGWVMEGSTGNRRPVASTGDLDGRIFSISPDGEWLLFSRTSTNEGEINSLWVVNLTNTAAEPIDTKITNVVNYADWVPGRSRTFSYSTVEAIPTAPGWNANNDFLIYRFDAEGNEIETELIVDKNLQGQSSWWGTSFEWSTDGSKVAFARPDAIGLVDLETGSLSILTQFDPYSTGSDWAWVPGIKWSPDDKILYSTLFAGNSTTPGQSAALSAILLQDNKVINLVPNCGLFCYPVPSPVSSDGRYSIAYLSAILPDQSETSRYNLKLMDRDASNQRKYYPGEGIQGLSPQVIKWSPSWSTDHLLAAVASGDLILLDTSTGSIKKITGDGSISKIDWK